MKILVSNDDGYDAPGITALANSLREVGDVTIIAPDSNRSGASNAITLVSAVDVIEQAPKVFSVSGTPADCLQVAFGGVIDYTPDIVISGINDGPNMGDDTLYSGTVAAAREGRFLKYPPIALSMASFEPEFYETAARVAVDVLKNLERCSGSDERRDFDGDDIRPVLNVNVPDRAYDELLGVKVTRLGTRHAPPAATLEEGDVSNGKYWLGPAGEVNDDSEDTDFHAVTNGFVSLTPLRIDQTFYEQLNNLDKMIQPAGT